MLAIMPLPQCPHSIISESPQKLERESVKVKTASPTHLRLTDTTTKSVFSALRGLGEISVKLMRADVTTVPIFSFSFRLTCQKFKRTVRSIHG